MKPGKNQIAEERIVLRLDKRIPAEQDLVDFYRSLPRTRRQELARKALLIGFKKIICEIRGGEQ